MQDRLEDLKNIIKTEPVEVTAHSKRKTKAKSAAHCKAISNSKKALYSSEEGKQVREKQSRSMKNYYQTAAGLTLLERLRSGVASRKQEKAIADPAIRKQISVEYTNGGTYANLSKKYKVSAASIKRYVEEFKQDLG